MKVRSGRTFYFAAVRLDITGFASIIENDFQYQL
jgi:hypothetical protein